MKLAVPRFSWNSIRFKVVAGQLLVTVPLLALLLYSNFYSIRVVHNQVALSNKNLISLYMGQIDDRLTDDAALITIRAAFCCYWLRNWFGERPTCFLNTL